jgi:hypothetical protein
VDRRALSHKRQNLPLGEVPAPGLKTRPRNERGIEGKDEAQSPGPKIDLGSDQDTVQRRRESYVTGVSP